MVKKRWFWVCLLSLLLWSNFCWKYAISNDFYIEIRFIIWFSWPLYCFSISRDILWRCLGVYVFLWMSGKASRRDDQTDLLSWRPLLQTQYVGKHWKKLLPETLPSVYFIFYSLLRWTKCTIIRFSSLQNLKKMYIVCHTPDLQLYNNSSTSTHAELLQQWLWNDNLSWPALPLNTSPAVWCDYNGHIMDLPLWQNR